MYFIAAFGLLLLYFAGRMIHAPQDFAKGIVWFSQQWFFHPFEILSRALAGIVMVLFAEQTATPMLFSILGYGLLAVAAGLTLTPPSRHRQFAVWSATAFAKYFRLIGVSTIPLALLLLYCALAVS